MPLTLPNAATLPVDPSHVVDVHPPALANDLTDVGDLATGLRVERRLAQHDRHAIVAELPHGGDLRLDLHGVVADERRLASVARGNRPRPSAFRLPRPLGKLVGRDADLLRLAVGLRLLALRPERRLEPRDVHGVSALARHELREIDREAVPVVEDERLLARNRPAQRGRALGRLARRQLVEARHAGVDRRQEALLFGRRRVDDVLRALEQLRINAAHALDDRLDDRGQRRLEPAEEPRVPNGAPQDAAEDVAAPLVRGEHAVGEQEGDRPRVIGDHAERGGIDRVRDDPPDTAGQVRRDAAPRLVALPAPVRHADHVLDRPENRREHVRVKVARGPLHHRRDPLEPGAGVDRRLGQRRQRAVGRPVELHEDEVPDLEEATRLRADDERVEREVGAVGLGPLAGGAGGKDPVARNVREIDEDLGARAARSRLPHLPEIVLLAEPVNARRGKPSDVLPQLARFLVGMVDGHSQKPRVEPQLLGHELPGEADRVVLEVVAEREVPEHLEERVMPVRVADLLEIVMLSAGADALLHRRRAAAEVGLFLSEKDLLELDHPGVREEQRRVVRRHERGARPDGVLVLLKVGEKSRADLGGLHASEYTPRSTTATSLAAFRRSRGRASRFKGSTGCGRWSRLDGSLLVR